MLVLTRKVGEGIAIGDDIKIVIMQIKGKQVRVGIQADPSTAVHREEIYQKIKEENKTAAASGLFDESKAKSVFSSVVSGVSDGSAVITASSISNPSKSDTCSVRVYADGQIEADDISIPGILTEGSTSLRLTNII